MTAREAERLAFAGRRGAATLAVHFGGCGSSAQLLRWMAHSVRHAKTYAAGAQQQSEHTLISSLAERSRLAKTPSKNCHPEQRRESKRSEDGPANCSLTPGQSSTVLRPIGAPLSLL